MNLVLSQPADQLRAGFLALRSADDVARLLEVSLRTLNYHIYRIPASKRYKTFSLQKRSGGLRDISAPATALKILQSKLNTILQTVYKPRPCVHGFTIGRSILSNAAEHKGRRYVFNVDLQDFFPSINFGRVRGMFMGKPYNIPSDAATVLAQVCCHENELPQGAPTSPIVANMTCAKLDGELQRLAGKCRCTYTRYADDLTFSTDMPRFPSDLAAVRIENGKTFSVAGDVLRVMIMSNGFIVNPNKVRLSSQCNRQEVTGLTTNLFPNVRRHYVSQIRAMLHAWSKFGLDAAEKEFRKKHDKHSRGPGRTEVSFRHVVRGKLAFLRMIRGQGNSTVVQLMNELARLDPHIIVDLAPLSIPASYRWLFDSLWVLESQRHNKQGTAFALKDQGLVTCAHAVEDDTTAYQQQNPTVKYPVKIVRKDDNFDLAVLAIDAVFSTCLNAEYGQAVKQGDQILLAGFPNVAVADTGYMAPCNVAGIRTTMGVRRIMITAAVANGNSGGPILNRHNRVIAIAVSGDPHEADKNSGISIDMLKNVK